VSKMGRKKVTVHAPRNVDLPAHVVMIPVGSGSSSGGSSEDGGHGKKSKSGKKCLCLSSWLTGLILLCVGVVVIAHYMLTDTARSVAGMRRTSGLQADQMAQVSCQDSTTTTLEDKIVSSDLIITASLEQKMGGTDLFHVHRDGRRPLKGGGDARGDFWLKVNSTSPCFESYSVAAAGPSPQVLFLRRVGEEPLFAPRFHPLPFSTKLVELMQKVINSRTGEQNQPEAVPVKKTNSEV